MRVLVLGMDGADHALVSRLIGQGRLPTLARLQAEGAFGPLRSTIPAITPSAWSSFLTGLEPSNHGIFNFSTNPNRAVSRIESAASRSGAPFWRTLSAAGVRSAFVTIPFTYPAEPFEGIVVTGYGGPIQPQILPPEAERAIMSAHPGLVTAHHPKAERWWDDFDRYTRLLTAHVEETGAVCRQVLDLEPELGVLCVNFMSSDLAGHLGYHRLEPDHPAHDPADAGDELVQVYAAIDRVCGQLIDHARQVYGEEPTAIILSDHGMKPIHWTFHANAWLEQAGYLRYRRRSLQHLTAGRLRTAALVDRRLVRRRRLYGRAFDRIPLLPSVSDDRAFADIDFGVTRAYAYASGGQLFLGELTGAVRDAGFAAELERELGAIRHPESGEPAFRVLPKRELYHGRHRDRAPEFVLLPHDERVYVDSTRRPWRSPFDRHDRLDPEIHYGYSGHHGVTGIIAAAGPGIRAGAEIPAGTDIVQMAATVLLLHGLAVDGLDGAPIAAMLADREGELESVAVTQSDGSDASVYSAQEEQELAQRLRDLGYE